MVIIEQLTKSNLLEQVICNTCLDSLKMIVIVETCGLKIINSSSDLAIKSLPLFRGFCM